MSLIGRLTGHHAVLFGWWLVVCGAWQCVFVVLWSGMYCVQQRRHYAWLAYYHLHNLW